MSHHETTAVGEVGQSAPALGASPLLLVVGNGHVASHPLVAGRDVVLGRDVTCDVPLDHPSISRRHALVRFGTSLTVEDAGSTNGVRVAGRRLDAGEQAPLQAGDGFQLGPFAAVVLGARSAIGESAEGRAALVVRDPGAPWLSDVVTRVARSDVSVLLLGETGVGKDILARALHAHSGRTGPLLSLNCATLSEPLLESELFGHERGAFTGAVQAKPGLFEAAAKGTVFLDEVGDLPLGVQAKLLRAIEARQVLRVGGVKPVALDVRFLAATHKSLNAEVARGAFRQDLYYRLNGITLSVPPLRERRDAIFLLGEQFLAEAGRRSGMPSPRLTATALARLTQHDWPGNVRELKAVLERAFLLAPSGEIDERHIVLDQEPAAPSPPVTLAEAPDVSERERIIAALQECAGNQTKAAKRLGISRTTLVYKLTVHRIPRPH